MCEEYTTQLKGRNTGATTGYNRLLLIKAKLKNWHSNDEQLSTVRLLPLHLTWVGVPIGKTRLENGTLRSSKECVSDKCFSLKKLLYSVPAPPAHKGDSLGAAGVSFGGNKKCV